MRTLLIAAAAAALLAGCPGRNVKPDLPPACAVVAPQVVFVDRVRYVAIDPDLTRPQPIAEGPLAQCPAVAAARRGALVKANAQLREIAEVEGTTVPAP